MQVLAIILGVFLVVSVLVDLINTLVATTTRAGRWWLTTIIYRRTYGVIRLLHRGIPFEGLKEQLLAVYAPVSVIVLLAIWVTQQVVGFGLIWWGLGGIDGSDSLFDSIYYSGVVYFTLGFGEVVPVGVVPRVGALVEAMSGVLTTALVIGYLPALYSAYSSRETKLMTLDDGREDRITPTNLILSRAPTGDVDDVIRFFEEWEEWIAEVIETHTTFPMLRLFRSKHHGQNWITALGLLADAALQCQIIVGARNRAPYWMLRRAIFLFEELADGADLSEYRNRLDADYGRDANEDGERLFGALYEELSAHGFELIPYEQARSETLALRRLYDAPMEYLIDLMLTPRGFWGHVIGLPMLDLPTPDLPIPDTGSATTAPPGSAATESPAAEAGPTTAER